MMELKILLLVLIFNAADGIKLNEFYGRVIRADFAGGGYYFIIFKFV